VPDALVGLVTADGKLGAAIRSSARGAYELRVPEPGYYALYARSLGFRPKLSGWIDVEARDTIAADLDLVAAPTQLTAAVIRAQRDSLLDHSILGMNLRAFNGRIVSPAEVDIAALGARDVADMVQRQAYPGILVDAKRRCVRSARGGSTGDCLPVMVDGILLSDPTLLDQVVPPIAVDYIVLLRSTETGVLFGSAGHDGALLVFTRHGPKRGPT
jgi:hypothetical protein